MNVIDFESLSNVNMIPDLDPLLQFFFHRLLFFSGVDLFERFWRKDGVFFLQNKVSWRVEPEKWRSMNDRPLSL